MVLVALGALPLVAFIVWVALPHRHLYWVSPPQVQRQAPLPAPARWVAEVVEVIPHQPIEPPEEVQP